MTPLTRLLRMIGHLLRPVNNALAAAASAVRRTVFSVARMLAGLVTNSSVAGVRRMRSDRRLSVITIILTTLLAAGLLDRAVDRASPAAEAMASGPDALNGTSTAWFCALTPSSRAQPGNGLITVANVGAAEVTGTVTVTPSAGAAVSVPLALGAGGRTVVRPGDLVDAPFSSATVLSNGGGIVVEHTVVDVATNSTSPCASSASNAWYLTDGSTTEGANVLLGLYNPFAEAALADFAFVTRENRQTPEDLEGVVINPRSMVVIDIGQYLKRRDWMTAKIITRTGRIVVDQLQQNRAGTRAGSSLALLSPRLSESWFIPNGYVTTGITDEINFYNPGTREAAVEVRFLPETPEAPPFQVLVPAEGRQQVSMNVEQVVPPGGRYTAMLRVTNGVPIAVGRTTVAAPEAPGPSTGLSISAATPAASRSWAAAVGATSQPANESLWIANPGDTAATVEMTASGNGQREELIPVTVGPGERFEVPLDEQRITSVADPAVLLRADAPILVGRDFARIGGPGYQSTAAIPVR